MTHHHHAAFVADPAASRRPALEPDRWTLPAPGLWGRANPRADGCGPAYAWYPSLHALLADLADADGAEAVAAIAFDGSLVAALGAVPPGTPLPVRLAGVLAARCGASVGVAWVGRFEDLCFAREPHAQAVRAGFYVESGAPVHTPIEPADVDLFVEYVFGLVA